MRRTKKGFTLAELLIVIAILGVLLAIVIPVFSGHLQNTQKTVCQANRRVALDMLRDECLVNEAFKKECEKFYYTPWSTVYALLEANGYSMDTEALCPAGGNIIVSYSAASKGCTLTCDKHDDMADTKLLGQYISFVTEYGSSYNNSNSDMRKAFWEANGKAWPTMVFEDTTYQIEPFYKTDSSLASAAPDRTWLFARPGTGDSGEITHNWNASLVFEPVSGKWYRYYDGYKYGASSEMNSCKSIADLQQMLAKRTTNAAGKTAYWEEIPSNQIKYNS
ncbi:MAG: prepilin-type N-terminal cleavage/methylation domain-containing protein [Eubacteriales bacterium]|nr:prepilin-type N-terminal cleavage/methylation domain-containing protein [Eubacteriales bacterium]